jgi:superfamily II DNA or RNA helicase
LADFRRAGPSALLACRSLDEGIDIPEVDAAILAASTQSLRQRVQRIGRTLRRGDGNKRPLIVTLVAQGTTDENVTADDRATFAGVATIYDEDDQSCLNRIRQLL